VLLPGTPAEHKLPLFLRGFHCIDLRPGLQDRQGIRELVRAILAQD